MSIGRDDATCAAVGRRSPHVSRQGGTLICTRGNSSVRGSIRPVPYDVVTILVTGRLRTDEHRRVKEPGGTCDLTCDNILDRYQGAGAPATVLTAEPEHSWRWGGVELPTSTVIARG